MQNDLLLQLEKLNKDCRNDLITKCININDNSEITECKLRLNVTQSNLDICSSEKNAGNINDLLKYQIEENAKMMNNCINQPNIKTVHEGGFRTSGKTEYNTSNKYCDTIAKQYVQYNLVPRLYKGNEKLDDSSKEKQDQADSDNL